MCLTVCKQRVKIETYREEIMSYLTQKIQELEEEKQERMNELFPSQYGELEHLTEEIYHLKLESIRAQNKRK